MLGHPGNPKSITLKQAREKSDRLKCCSLKRILVDGGQSVGRGMNEMPINEDGSTTKTIEQHFADWEGHVVVHFGSF